MKGNWKQGEFTARYKAKDDKIIYSLVTPTTSRAILIRLFSSSWTVDRCSNLYKLPLHNKKRGARRTVNLCFSINQFLGRNNNNKQRGLLFIWIKKKRHLIKNHWFHNSYAAKHKMHKLGSLQGGKCIKKCTRKWSGVHYQIFMNTTSEQNMHTTFPRGQCSSINIIFRFIL